MNSDYVKQLEEANQALQQKVEQLQVSNENLSSELSKYSVRFKNFSKTQWQIFVGYALIGNIKFYEEGFYTIRNITPNSGEINSKFASLDECRHFIIKYITEKPEGNGWKITI